MNGRPAGHRSAEACTLAELLLRVADEHHDRPAVIVADLTGTIYCDCAAIRSLCHAARYAAAHGTDLRLVIPAGPVRRVLHLTGRDRELHLYPAIASALTNPPVRPLP